MVLKKTKASAKGDKDWLGDKEEKVKKEKEIIPKMSVEFTTTKADLLGLLDIVGCVLDEFALTCDKDGIRVNAVDPAHVAMMVMDVPAKYFDEYKYKNENKSEVQRRIGVSCTKLKEFLKTLAITDEIAVSYDNETTQLILRSGRIKRSMSELDAVGMSEPKVPSLNQPTLMRMTNEMLKEALVSIAQVSDFVKIEAKKDSIDIFGEGDIDKVELHFTALDKIEIEGEPSVAMYPLDYLQSFSKAIGAKSQIVLQIGTDYPATISFLVEGKKGEASGKYLLAPRIASD